jgi:ParB family chromosome partitioning protein
MQCEYYALEGITHIMQIIQRIQGGLNPKLQLLGILLTMYDKRSTLNQQIANDIRFHFQQNVFTAVIPRNVKIAEAPSHGKPIILYDVKSTGGIEMIPTRPTLGKGLAALLGEVNIPHAQQTPQSINVTSIQAGRNQPRQEFSQEELSDLVLSVQRKGILQPLLVRQIQAGRFEIIAGERRWRAAKLANLERVPVVIINCNDQEALEIGLIENLQRHDLNPVEESEAIKRLQGEFNLTQEQIASSIGKSRSYVANMMRLSALSPQIKALIRDNKLSAGHARAIITSDNPDELVEEILQEKLSVRDTEQLVKKQKKLKFPEQKIAKEFSSPIDSDIESITSQLSETLDMKVNLAIKGEAGALTIHFKNLSQLDKLLEILQ